MLPILFTSHGILDVHLLRKTAIVIIISLPLNALAALHLRITLGGAHWAGRFGVPARASAIMRKGFHFVHIRRLTHNTYLILPVSIA